MAFLVSVLISISLGENCKDIWNDFARFYRKITSESQLRWVGPEKGVVHLATGAIINAIWVRKKVKCKYCHVCIYFLRLINFRTCGLDMRINQFGNY
jgi:hypothetical protein